MFRRFTAAIKLTGIKEMCASKLFSILSHPPDHKKFSSDPCKAIFSAQYCVSYLQTERTVQDNRIERKSARLEQQPTVAFVCCSNRIFSIDQKTTTCTGFNKKQNIGNKCLKITTSPKNNDRSAPPTSRSAINPRPKITEDFAGRRRRQNMRLFRLLLLSSASYFTCWLPVVIGFGIKAISDFSMPSSYTMFSKLCSFAGGIVNPIVYCILDKRNADSFKKTFRPQKYFRRGQV